MTPLLFVLPVWLVNTLAVIGAVAVAVVACVLFIGWFMRDEERGYFDK